MIPSREEIRILTREGLFTAFGTESWENITALARLPGTTHLALYECQLIGSTYMGETRVIAVGPERATRVVDDLPRITSFRGLASDTSTLIGVCPVEEVLK